MPSRSPFTLATGHGPVLHGIVDLPDAAGARPTVLILHGFKGFMEWGFFPCLAELLASRGMTAVRVNLSGAGMRPGDDLVTDLAAFGGATICGDLADEAALLAALVAGAIAPGRVDASRLGLLGHSRGGGTALLTAASPAGLQRVRALVTWNAVGTFDRFTPEERAVWRRDGVLPAVNTRTGQSVPVSVAVLDDIETNREALDLERAAARRTAPWLIVHGSADERVPLAEGRALAAAAAPPCELLIVEGGSHTFGAVHPFAGPTPHLIQALNATQAWFRRHLRVPAEG